MWVLTLIVALSSGNFQVEVLPMETKVECLRHAEVALNMKGYDFEVIMVSCNQIKEI